MVWRVRFGSIFTAVPDFKSVGVKDGARTFAYPVIIRAVNTVDAYDSDS